MKLGIMIDSLGASQLACTAISEINKANSFKDFYVDINVFFHKNDKMLLPSRFAIFQEQQAWGFDGPVFATELSNAKTLLNCPCPTKKFFYVWDLEWIYNMFYYEVLAEIYLNPNLHLVARNQYHFNFIKNCWKEPVAIIEDFNHEKIIKLAKSTS